MKASVNDGGTDHGQDGEWGLNRLCDVCSALRFDFAWLERTRSVSNHSLYQDLRIETPRVRHYTTANDLLRSASLDCHLCTLTVACFRGLFELNKGVDVARDDPCILAYMMTLIPNGLYLSINQSMDSLRLYADSGSKQSVEYEIAELPLIRNPETDGSRQYYLFAPIASISTRFQTCLGRHSLCRSQGRSHLPTRVLDISRGVEGVRLITVSLRTKSGGNKLKRLAAGYATVSHRWQADLQCKTTTTNIKHFHKVIPFADIPQHFRDAIVLARKLGIQLLWIDSLCIIQEGDNGEDFNREALKMASVYEGAQFNISIDVHDASRGFLPLNLREVRACTIPAFAGLATDLWIAPWPFMIPRTGPAVDKGGLEDRAWILQERLLARRAIHCTPFGLIWECHEDHAGLEEQAPKRQVLLPGVDLLPLLSRATKEQEFYSLYRDKENLWKYNLWYAVVEEFARRQITVPSDKLISISGIAKRFAAIHEDLGQYVAGLWTGDIAFGLGWYCPGADSWSCMDCTESHELADERAKRQAYRPLKGLIDYRAPSFSWAAAEDNNWVFFTPPRVSSDRANPDEDKYQPTLISVSMETHQSDPFGLPIRGSIVLKGFHASRTSFSKCAWVNHKIAHKIRFQLGETGKLFMDDILYHRLRRPVDLPEKSILFLIAIMPLVRGIVLYPVPNKDKRRRVRYRRIGLWAVMEKEEQEMYDHCPFDFSFWTETTIAVI